MSNDAHILNLLPAYALECLDKDEHTLVSEHLTRCPACQNELGAYLSVADRLALAVPVVSPVPDNLKRQLTERVQASSQTTHPPSPQKSWRHSLKSLFVWQPTRGWSVATLALILVLATGNLLLWRQLRRSSDGPQLRGMQTLSLVNTQVDADANGVLIISSDSEYGSLVVENLPLLNSEQRYQLWLIQDKKLDSGAIFSVDAHGYRATEVNAPDSLGNYSAFTITIEPAKGSVQPTGPEVLTSIGFSLQSSQ